MRQAKIENEIFYKIVQTLEEKVSMSAYYTVELACQRAGIQPEYLQKQDVNKVIDEIIEIYKDYYPHRVKDVKKHLEDNLLQNLDIKKKRRRFFRFF